MVLDALEQRFRECTDGSQPLDALTRRAPSLRSDAAPVTLGDRAYKSSEPADGPRYPFRRDATVAEQEPRRRRSLHREHRQGLDRDAGVLRPRHHPIHVFDRCRARLRGDMEPSIRGQDLQVIVQVRPNRSHDSVVPRVVEPSRPAQMAREASLVDEGAKVACVR